MNVQSISFGKKIPRYTCQVQNKETGEFVPATLYEYNCEDESDIREVKKLDRRWSFKDSIAHGMDVKYTIQTIINEQSNDSFYSMQVGKDIVGLAQISTHNGISNIDYITTKPKNPYKYVGQTLIAGIGKQLLKKNAYQMTVTTAIDDAAPFYEKIGFRKFGDSIYRMNHDDIQTLIEVTELQTESPILDKRA